MRFQPLALCAKVRFALPLCFCVLVLSKQSILCGQAAQPNAPEATSSRFAGLGDFSQSLETLAARVRPAVVQIISTGYAASDDDHAAGSTSLLTRQRSTGSGVILASDGFIVTNNHVVQNARKIEVKLAAYGITKATTVTAKLVGSDRQTDLAVIKVDVAGLPFLQLGTAKDIHTGQLVMAFGNPFGLEGSVSMGIVSSTGRQVREDDSLAYIQTDAPINPGNSGGPLVDSAARVVGINTFIFTRSGGSEGIGFAIPSEVVRNVFDQIRKDGHVHRGQIGIGAQPITPDMAKALKLPQDSGVIAADVIPGGPADHAGLQVNDIITALNGQNISDVREMQSAIYSQPLDKKIQLTVRRGESTQTFSVAVVERQDDPQRFADMVDPEKNVIKPLGILVIEVNDEVKAMLPTLRHSYGLVIAAEEGDAPYSGENLRTGDVIYEVNGQPTVTIKSLNEILGALKSGDPVVLQVERNGGLQYLTIELD